MRFLTIAVKAFKERIRNRNVLGMQLLFPAVFMLVFGIAFTGAGFDRNRPYDIIVINDDLGARTGDGYLNLGQELETIMEDATYENSSINLFAIKNATADEALTLLKDRDVVCVVTIPEDFSRAVRSMINTSTRIALTSAIGEGLIPPEMGIELPQEGETTAQVLIQGDSSYQAFGAVQSMVVGIINSYLENAESAAIEQAMSGIPGTPPVSEAPEFVTLYTQSIAGTEESSNFDYFAPGIIVFGLLLGVIAVAESLAREVEDRTLSRLKISLMSSFDLLFGSLISWTLFAGIQVLILFGIALALGYNWVGGTTSLTLAIGIGCIVGVACISLGMLIAAFAKSTEQASSLGTLIAVPMSFVIGVFIGFPPGLFTRIIAVLPWRQGLLSLLEVLTYGSTLEEVTPNLTALVIETVVLFVAGVVAFSKLRLKAE